MQTLEGWKYNFGVMLILSHRQIDFTKARGLFILWGSNSAVNLDDLCSIAGASQCENVN